jgi:hypothetical protein
VAAADGLFDVHRTEVSGMPAFWGLAPGPFAAGVIFRVGRADEVATHSGITHLVEHLALPAVGSADVDFNGAVSCATTWLWAAGERDASLRFLQQTVASLSDLPQRVETERRILLTEAAGRGDSAFGIASSLRFGPVGHGLIGYPEFGLRWLDHAAAQDWSRERFTAANAALWMIGEPPAGLDLQLPPGTRRSSPVPEPTPGIPFPSVYPASGSGFVAASMLMERSTPASVVASIALERVRQQLRYERGLSYAVDLIWEPLTADAAHAVLVGDCRQGAEREAAALLRRVLEELAESGPSELELAKEVEERRKRASDMGNLAGHLFAAAASELLGNDFASPRQLVAEAREVTPGSAVDALTSGLESALLLTQDERWQPHDRWSTYPLFSEGAVSGRSFRPHGPWSHEGRNRKTRVVTGSDGVSFVNADGQAITVEFDDCAALEQWPDGLRVLWGRDATRLAVHPDAWSSGTQLTPFIDEHVPADRVVPMNPAVEKAVTELEQRLGGKRGQRAILSRELRAASGYLDFGETPLDVLLATLEDKIGLLIVTERRLLFTFGGQPVVDLPLDAITFVQERGGRWPRGKSLAVGADEMTNVFRDPFPAPHRAVFMQTLREQLESRVADDFFRDSPPWHASVPAYASLVALPLSFGLLFPATIFEETGSHARLIATSILVLLACGGSCAGGIWLGLLGRRRAADGAEGARAAKIGIVLGALGLLFWLTLAVLVPASEW